METEQGVGPKWSDRGMEMGREGVGGQEERRQMEEAEPPAANTSGQDGDGGWRRSGARVGAGWRDGGMGRESGAALGQGCDLPQLLR